MDATPASPTDPVRGEESISEAKIITDLEFSQWAKIDHCFKFAMANILAVVGKKDTLWNFQFSWSTKLFQETGLKAGETHRDRSL